MVRKLEDNSKMTAKRIKLEKDGKYMVPEGEDSTSFARHNSSLQAEAKTRNPKRSVVSELMKISFEMRWNSIVEEPKPLRQLFETYPFLKDCDEVQILVLLCMQACIRIKICCI